jgi:hypothetical protein
MALYIRLTQQLVFGFLEYDYSAEVFYGDLAVPIYEIFNLCSFKQENKGQMKAKHQDIETLLTEKFLIQRTYFIVHLQSGLCNRTTACRKRVIIFENSDFIA